MRVSFLYSLGFEFHVEISFGHFFSDLVVNHNVRHQSFIDNKVIEHEGLIVDFDIHDEDILIEKMIKRWTSI